MSSEPITAAPQAPARSRLDTFFSNPAAAVVMAILCNILWGCAFPFIKLGYRLFSIGTTDTPTILCFAGVRFMLGGLMVYLVGSLMQRKPLRLPGRPAVTLECCALGLWQTTAQYAFYYTAVANLTGAFGSILNSSSSFIGVILAHFLYGKADRITPRKALGCALGFGGVLAATLGNHGGGGTLGIVAMLTATCIFSSSGPWNKRVSARADSFMVCTINLGLGGAVLFLLGFALGGRLHLVAAGMPALLFLAFISAAGYLLWALLMKNNPVSRISVFGLIIPVVTTLLSALLNGEALFEWQYLVALALVCVGIVLVNRPAKKAVTA